MPSTIGSFNAYACTRAGVTSLLFHTVDGDSINAYAPHTLCTKLARISLAGIIGTTSAPLMYFNNSQPLNNANVYKGVQQVGSKLPRLGATKAFNVANAAAVAGDANGPQLPVGGFSDVEASLFPASLGGGNVSAKGTISYANIFGVVVSTNLYRALQAAQGITAADAGFNPAFAPNITSSQ